MMSNTDFYTVSNDKNVGYSQGCKIIRKLGEGTFSTVFLTQFFDANNQKKPSEQLACKIMDTSKAPKYFIEKFLPREINILKKLSHPHIIHVHSIFKKNYKYLIFMRYAENGDLLNFIIKKGAVSEDQTRMWIKQISLALQYLHEMEIAHRDIKCENILITSNYNAKVSDFGFARYVINKKGMRILSETYCGSTSYCPPEIIKGIPYNPKASDLWSLGVVIFVMLNKSLPFDSGSVKKLYEQQIKRLWKFEPQVENSTSSQVKELLQSLLEPNIQKRFTISEVLSCDWMLMDHRIIGMTELESIALAKANEERKKMEQHVFTLKNKVQNNIQHNKDMILKNDFKRLL